MKNKLLYIGIVAIFSVGFFCIGWYMHQSAPISTSTSVPTLDSPQYVSELGFSFNYPKDMYVMSDFSPSDTPRIYIIPNSYKTDKNPTITAVVISASVNVPPMTPLEWLKGPNSGADMSKGYTTLNMDSQEAISMNGGSWIVVNTHDNMRQLSIATLPSLNPGQSLVIEMDSIINSFVFSR